MKSKHKVLKNIRIEKFAAQGKCLARVDNQVIFVRDVAPGDVVDLKITRNKKSYAEAIPLGINEFSTLRQEPFCAHFDFCGGCKWQHIRYEEQLKFKEQEVREQLEHIGKLELPEISPIIQSFETTYYRNKLEFSFSDRRWFRKEEMEPGDELDPRGVGFHMPGRYDRILDIEHCHLQPEPSNQIRNTVKALAKEYDLSFFDLKKKTGLIRNLIVRTASTGQVMVILQFTTENEKIHQLMQALQEQVPSITCLLYVINNKGNDTIHDLPVKVSFGKEYIEEEMKDPAHPDEKLTFRIGPKSFFQTNLKQAEALYHKVWEMAALTGEECVYDLYTGTGTIASYLSSSAKEVIGIEYIESAVEDARVNAEINALQNMKFVAGDMKDLLNETFISKNGQPDVIVTDPPRAGMHADVCETIMNTGARKIVYVSCNPATQARDLSLLSGKYNITAIQPVDMFPHTHHVENIAVLELRTID